MEYYSQSLMADGYMRNYQLGVKVIEVINISLPAFNNGIENLRIRFAPYEADNDAFEFRGNKTNDGMIDIYLHKFIAKNFFLIHLKVCKTELSWWSFVMADLMTLIFALLTVSWQAWRAARRNPVEALRYE